MLLLEQRSFSVWERTLEEAGPGGIANLPTSRYNYDGRCIWPAPPIDTIAAQQVVGEIGPAGLRRDAVSEVRLELGLLSAGGQGRAIMHRGLYESDHEDFRAAVAEYLKRRVHPRLEQF